MTTALSALSCPSCGAPVRPRMGADATCAYCMRSLTGVPEASWAALIGRLAEEDDAADERTRCRVAGCPFVVRGLLAHGEHADVFLAERLYPTELCVLKVLRARADNAAFAREWGVLTRLSGDDAPEASFFTSLLPQPVLRGTLTSRNTSERAAMAYRWQSGFLYTLRDVAAAYPAGLDVETAVWLWRRTLHLLGWVHQVGVAHGAVNPEHVLVHPRDHRILLVGWSAAKDAGREAACGDLQMSAECIKLVLGARLESAPEALRDLVLSTADRAASIADASSLSREVASAAKAAFGPPKFHPFSMPGWR